MMYKTMNGPLYRSLLDYGIRNLALHSEEVNDLNIFPVPDGDTGTNMVTTLRNGYRAIESEEGDLPALSKRFAGAVVYGARGNSGVIVSQFFKGFSESLARGGADADTGCVARALDNGVKFAYRAVSNPVEGTILTVVREAAEHVKEREGEHSDLSELIDAFLTRARVSLENTPNLLPVLKSAGVVDSGGVGIVYVFEGMYKYLNDETIADAALKEEIPVVDYSRFDRKSVFEYGYCTECLLQLTDTKLGGDEFDYEAFRSGLNELGESVVTSHDCDKIKLHIHTNTPEAVLTYAHQFGEFLSLKIENMSVQHSVSAKTVTVSGEQRGGAFAVVAVATDEKLGRIFLDMGADAVISAAHGYSPSTQDFLEAFAAVENNVILVFPNNKNLILAAEQARELSPERRVTVIDAKSVADCYAALAMVDFDSEDAEAVAEEIAETVSNVRTVAITRAVKDARYGAVRIEKGDIIAVSGTDVLAVGETLSEVALSVIDGIMAEDECDTVTLFTGMHISEADAVGITDHIAERYAYTETDLVETYGDLYDLILSFE